jgi:hypothetical protein
MSPLLFALVDAVRHARCERRRGWRNACVRTQDWTQVTRQARENYASERSAFGWWRSLWGVL